MPARPTGANLVADFMGYYFNSADAFDLCLQRRDRPRHVPRPRWIRAGAARRSARAERWRATNATSSSSAAASRPRWWRRSCRSSSPTCRSSSSKPASGSSTSRIASSTAQRNLDYGENQWPGDFVADQGGRGIISRVDGRRRIGAALGRRVQSLLRGRHAAEVDVRPGRGLADRLEGAREVLLRGRAAHRRVGRAEPAAGRRAVRAVSDAAR